MDYLHVQGVKPHARIQEFLSGGVQVSLTKKALTTIFFFLVLSLFYRRQMVNFKEIYHFSRFQRASNIFQGGGGGSYCLFSIETHITCDFQGGGGGVRTPCPPLWIRTNVFLFQMQGPGTCIVCAGHILRRYYLCGGHYSKNCIQKVHGGKFSGLFLNSGFWGWLSTESQPQNAELGRL